MRDRTDAEKVQFLQKALSDEISEPGLLALRRHGRFSPLDEIFPREGTNWAAQAGVNSTDCLAFRMEREGIRAEVVLVRVGES